MYSSVEASPFPVLVHVDGFVEWGNPAFVNRFGINPATIKRLKVRELLWCLGIPDPLARIVAEGATFPEMDVASLAGAAAISLRLRQTQMDGCEPLRPHLVLSIDERQTPAGA